MNKSKKTFVFDFDGVICDSTYECLINSFNSYNFYSSNKKNLIQSIKDIDGKLVKDFKLVRPYIKGAKEYLKFYDYYENEKNINIKNFIEYENQKLDFDKFSKIFYSMREDLKKKNLDKWISLNLVFSDVKNFLNSLDSYFIATLKDKKSVIEIMKFHRIKIHESKILDFSIINSKIEALDKIINDYSIKKSDLIFVDDNAFHLIEPNYFGFKVFLSNWADLNNDKHIEIANENKIDIIDNIGIFNEKNSRYTS